MAARLCHYQFTYVVRPRVRGVELITEDPRNRARNVRTLWSLGFSSSSRGHPVSHLTKCGFVGAADAAYISHRAVRPKLKSSLLDDQPRLGSKWLFGLQLASATGLGWVWQILDKPP